MSSQYQSIFEKVPGRSIKARHCRGIAVGDQVRVKEGYLFGKEEGEVRGIDGADALVYLPHRMEAFHISCCNLVSLGVALSSP